MQVSFGERRLTASRQLRILKEQNRGPWKVGRARQRSTKATMHSGNMGTAWSTIPRLQKCPPCVWQIFQHRFWGPQQRLSSRLGQCSSACAPHAFAYCTSAHAKHLKQSEDFSQKSLRWYSRWNDESKTSEALNSAQYSFEDRMNMPEFWL